MVVLKDAVTGRVKEVRQTSLDGSHNIVTSAGARYYAHLGASSTTSFTFNRMTVAASCEMVLGASVGATYGLLVLADNTSAVPTGGAQAFDATYPKVKDADADNTGSGSNVVTWLRTYSTTQGNTDVKCIVLHQAAAHTGVGVAAGTNFLINAATLAVSVTKTSSDTLKVFVNHTFTGV